MEIKVELSKNLKKKPDMDNLGFGQYYTDHMFEMDYTEGIGWHDRYVSYLTTALKWTLQAWFFTMVSQHLKSLKAYKTRTEQ